VAQIGVRVNTLFVAGPSRMIGRGPDTDGRIPSLHPTRAMIILARPPRPIGPP
jgi:hypothetical protein